MGREIKVAAISENYVGHFIYLNRATYEQVYGTSPKDNTYLVKLKEATPSNTEKEAAVFMKKAAVSGVVQMQRPSTSLNLWPILSIKPWQSLSLFPVLLAIVILYNLTNINVAERIQRTFHYQGSRFPQ